MHAGPDVEQIETRTFADVHVLSFENDHGVNERKF